jgi:transposase InsO family protein
LCVETLEEALAHHDRPDIFNIDQGSQFTGSAFIGVFANNGIAVGMDSKGAWRDYVLVEPLWRSVKYEDVYLRACGRPAARFTAISDPIIAAAHVRALTARRPIEPHSPFALELNSRDRTTGANFSRSV